MQNASQSGGYATQFFMCYWCEFKSVPESNVCVCVCVFFLLCAWSVRTQRWVAWLPRDVSGGSCSARWSHESSSIYGSSAHNTGFFGQWQMTPLAKLRWHMKPSFPHEMLWRWEGTGACPRFSTLDSARTSSKLARLSGVNFLHTCQDLSTIEENDGKETMQVVAFALTTGADILQV